MPERMPDRISEYRSHGMSVGGDHSKKLFQWKATSHFGSNAKDVYVELFVLVFWVVGSKGLPNRLAAECW